jgi:hypothetical protein
MASLSMGDKGASGKQTPAKGRTKKAAADHVAAASSLIDTIV